MVKEFTPSDGTWTYVTTKPQTHNSKETSVPVMFVNVPSDIMTEMLSLSVRVLTNSDALKDKNSD